MKNTIKQIKIKAKERPWHLLVMVIGFILLALLICIGVFLQSSRSKKISKEEQSVLMKETGALRDDFQAEIKTLTDTLNQKETDLTESEKMIKELMENSESVLETKFNEQIQILSDHVSTLKEEITNTKSELIKIEKEIESGDSENAAQVEEAIAALSVTLKRLDQDFGAAREQLQSLAEEIRKNNGHDSEKVLEKLSEVEKKLTLQNQSDFSEIAKLFESSLDKYKELTDQMAKELTTKIEEQYSQVSGKYAELNTAIQNRYDALDVRLETYMSGLDKSIANYFEQASLGNNQGTDKILGYLEQKFAVVDSKLAQVFQYVSNGKRLLASALLTKGVEIPEDATFEQIKEAILNIKQDFYIQTDSMPGRVEYEYHFHTDAQGVQYGDDSLNEASGCYVSPIYHVHEGDPVNGGGCYSVVRMHEHSGSSDKGGGCYSVKKPIVIDCDYSFYSGDRKDSQKCPKCGSSMWVNQTDTNMYRYFCTGANNGKVSGYTYSLGCGKQAGEIEGYDTDCGKVAGETIEGYAPGCGYLNGQIIAAKIYYEGRGVPENENPGEIIVETEEEKVELEPMNEKEQEEGCIEGS